MIMYRFILNRVSLTTVVSESHSIMIKLYPKVPLNFSLFQKRYYFVFPSSRSINFIQHLQIEKQIVPELPKQFCTKWDNSHHFGKLTIQDLDKKIRIRGYLQFMRLGLGFIVLRDSSGLIQILIKNTDTLKDVNYESYLEVIGTVKARPENQVNKNLLTGEIEIEAEDIKVLNHARPNLPFLIRDKNKPTESLALKYRYLHLRYPHMQQILRLRSQINKKMRDYLHDIDNFVEITTPTLSATTPGGSKEYVVPTQIPKKFYSLVQSPQTYKQLSIIGGFEKYYQFAICYRDEGTKSDRQPEFMQLDIEMANCTENDVKTLMENIIRFSWPNSLSKPSYPFPCMAYEEAFSNYGCDKPDTRFEWKLKNITTTIKNCGSEVLLEALRHPKASASAFVIPNGDKFVKKKLEKDWNSLAQTKFKLPGVTLLRVKDDGSVKGASDKILSLDATKRISQELLANIGDIIVLAVGVPQKALNFLGHLRLLAADLLEAQGEQVRDEKKLNFLWVVDFPLFEEDEDTGRLVSCHHPFTAPKEQIISRLKEDLLQVKSQHYDLVLNGCEIAGGSIRIHDAVLQKEIFELLNIDPQQLSFLLEALESGAPPHGGIAMGFDRYIAMLHGCDSIRDVMAFPKSGTGKCYLTGAPSDITETERNLYHL